MKPDFAKIFHSIRNFVEKNLHPKRFWLLLLALCFVISSLFWAFSPPVRACTLFFKEAKTHKLVPTLRFIARQKNQEAEIESILEELFLGPTDAWLLPLSVPQAGVNTVIRSGKTFYVDISADVLFGKKLGEEIYGEPILPFGELLEILQKVLHKNYPSSSFIVTINGMQIDENAVPATKINNLIDKGTTMAIINIKLRIMNAHYERST